MSQTFIKTSEDDSSATESHFLQNSSAVCASKVVTEISSVSQTLSKKSEEVSSSTTHETSSKKSESMSSNIAQSFSETTNSQLSESENSCKRETITEKRTVAESAVYNSLQSVMSSKGHSVDISDRRN